MKTRHTQHRFTARFATESFETAAAATDIDNGWDMADFGDWMDVTDLFEMFE